MYEEIERLTYALCAAPGTPGDEAEAMEAAKKALSFCGEVIVHPLGGVTGILGNKNAKRRLLFDAHVDQIGLAVTQIDEKGFLHVTGVGGVDCRTMPGSPITVYGSEALQGVVAMLPVHANDKSDKVKPVQEQIIDLGIEKEEVEKLISVGDRAALTRGVKKLMGNRVSGTALDDRAGCACIIRAAQLIHEHIEKLNCCVMVLCSTREEVGGQGAQISTYALEPTEAVAVDVSFAKQPGADQLTAELGAGPMIGYSAALDRRISKRLTALAEKHGIPYQTEVMGGRTGTNCDEISISRGGVRTGLISVPQRNMHTPAEICDLEDMEDIAKLLAAYAFEGEEADHE